MTYGGWDFHTDIVPGTRRETPPLDKAFAALIRDLDRTGLLDSTIVMLSSEFGRTPKVNGTRGRDHWPRVFSIVLAGGGIARGKIYGASTATAAEPDSDEIGPGDLFATLYQQLGIDYTKAADGARRPADRHHPRRATAAGVAGVRSRSLLPRGTASWLPDSGIVAFIEKLRTAIVLSGRRDLRYENSLVFLRPRFMGVARAWPPAPEIDRFAPRGAQRGTEIDVVFSGPRLGDARGLLLYEPGIAVKSLEVLPDKRVKARLALAGDCPLGPHALRMQTATGISNLVTFSAGALPEIDEIEPNNDFAKPQKISLNTTVNGVVLNEDVDYFAVEAKKGQRFSAEVEGLRLGETLFDPYLAIMDTNRFVLAAADDTPLLRQDCACSLIVPRDGTYVIQVRESAFGGSDRCHYRLHVGTFPRPLAVYPAGGKFGQTLDVTYIGDPSGPMRQKLTLPSGPQPGYAVWAQDGQGIAPSPNPFRLSPLGQRVGEGAERRRGSRHAFHRPRRAQWRHRSARRQRLLGLSREERPDVRRARFRPATSHAAGQRDSRHADRRAIHHRQRRQRRAG